MISLDIPARERLLLAGAQLLEYATGADVSTRAICDLAHVQAPALYHHFGSKQGLLDEVVSHGFRQYLREDGAELSAGADPIDAVKKAWDTHVNFGLNYPTFYSYIYGRATPGQRCGVVDEVESMILETLKQAAREGTLLISPADAAAEILAASSGVILSLITAPQRQASSRMSERVRDAVIDSLTRAHSETATAGVQDRAASAVVVLQELIVDRPEVLGSAESAVLGLWLEQISTSLTEVGNRR